MNNRYRKMLSLAIVLIIITASIFIMGAAPARERKIVVFEKGSSASARYLALKKHGATEIHNLSIINASGVWLPPGKAKKLAAENSVVKVVDDPIMTIIGKPIKKPKPPKTDTTEPLSQPLPWGISHVNVNADDVWSISTGKDVKVAVLDTGIDLDHPDLNVAGNINKIEPSSSGDDDNGHGTHVAGTIAALDNTFGAVGMAPDAELYAVKVLNRRGIGYTTDIIAGIQWSIKHGIEVINMSLGGGSKNDSFEEAIKAAVDSGIVVVCAAGNNSGDVIYPAAYEDAIAVSAVDSSNNLAYFSNFGSDIDVAAPGVAIYSTYRNGRYKTYSGTSMAAPHVAGLAALLIGKGISAVKVRGIITATAEDIGDPGEDVEFGYGLINAYEAVN